MRKIIWSTAFKRDTKKLQRQGKNLALLVQIFDHLAENIPIPPHYRDHALKGKWKRRRELHIEPDWLLIYRVENNIVYLERTGSHAELFKL